MTPTFQTAFQLGAFQSNAFQIVSTGELMAILTAGELAAMRGDIELLMPDLCQIITITNTADSEGGVTTSRATATAIDCRLDAVQGVSTGEQRTGGAIQAYQSYMLSIPYDSVVLPENEILISGVNYAVKSINRGQSWKAVVRVELERL
jgi:hypothetical protein